jgi:hypothetical protein
VRLVGLLGFWASGLLGFWASGLLGFWASGLLGQFGEAQWPGSQALALQRIGACGDAAT